MTTLFQLSPPIQVKTPLGDGWALIIFEYGININSVWLVRLDATGQVKHIESNDIIIQPNPMLHQPKII